MANKNLNHATRFKPGNKLGGRPKGSRDKVTEAYLKLIDEEVANAKDGQGSLADLRKNDPATFWRLVAQLVPKDIEARIAGDLTINIVKFGHMDDQEAG